MDRLAVFTHPDCRRHRPGIGHPESPDRLRAALDGVPPGIPVRTAPSGSPSDLALIHDRDYIATIRDQSAAGMVMHTDPDTVLSPGTWDAALGAVGAMRMAVEAVMHDRVQRAFCVVRPPGHHARTDATMGFCFFNTLAIGARILLSEFGINRIAVIDWDAHHGNGTQDAFYDDNRVLYASVHQVPLFPGSGPRRQRGRGDGDGLTVNIPLAPGATDTDLDEAFRKEIEPAVTAYRPEMIMVSAGFDGHTAERLAGWMLTEDGYFTMTQRVVALAERFARGRIISLFEGGYNLTAVTACVNAHLRALCVSVAQ